MPVELLLLLTKPYTNLTRSSVCAPPPSFLIQIGLRVLWTRRIPLIATAEVARSSGHGADRHLYRRGREARDSRECGPPERNGTELPLFGVLDWVAPAPVRSLCC